MFTVRCSICRLRFQKLKLLYIHYLKFHSKNKIIWKLLEQNSKQVLFRSQKRNLKSSKNVCLKSHVKKRSRVNKISQIKSYQTESFILRENIRIFCGNSEIISIGDNKQNVKLSFNNETQKDCYLAWSKNDRKCKKLPTRKLKPANKKKIKKKKVPKRNIKEDYHINITKLQNTISLDDQIGVFYTCHCRDNDCLESGKFPNSDLRLVNSDTESCSDTSKNSVSPEESKIFCDKCGSGYKTEAALSEHMFVHEPFCRLCNTWFPNEFTFKQHMQLHKISIFACHFCKAEFPLKETLLKHLDCHIENKVLEDVLDMENDYTSFKGNFLNNNYNSSITNIMCYLTNRPDIYYCNSKFIKTVCDICYKEVFVEDYQNHLQVFHI